MRRWLILTLAGVFAVGITGPPTAGAHVGFDLHAAGTATIDGVMSAGEWDNAGSVDFTMNLPGGGTAPAKLYEMNDDANLYLAVAFSSTLGLRSSTVTFEFDNDHDNVWPEEGDDALVLTNSFRYIPTEGFDATFADDVRHYDATHTPAWWGPTDTFLSGTADGAGAATVGPAVYALEVAHPLDSADDAHDFSLHTGSTVGMNLQLRVFPSTGGSTFGSTVFPVDAGNPFGGLGFGNITVDPYHLYTFVGFSAPVDNQPAVNVATAGRTIPLKWRVLDRSGAPVTDLTSVQVTARNLSCDLGVTSDLVEEYAAGESGLQNLGDGYYQFNWKTPKAYANSCKLVSVDLGDLELHSASFRFTR